MSSISDKLAYIAETKELIRKAIIAKGVDVSENDTFRSYADKIGQISDCSVEYNTGDVCLYNMVRDKLMIVGSDDWSIEEYPSSNYIPVGVVVIPSSHDVYGTGECAVMSLKTMDPDTPDNGSTSDIDIYWGGYGTEIKELSYYETNAITGNENDPGDGITVTGAEENSYLPSDSFVENGGHLCPADDNAVYHDDIATRNAAPSPYLTDGSRNNAYYATEDSYGNDIVNGFSDFDGKQNTEAIIKLSDGQEDWQTAETITNNGSDTDIFPSACCCWRYHTEGTEQGQWYFPSCGEFGYVISRLKTINDTILRLVSDDAYGSEYGVGFNMENSGKGYSTSTSVSDNDFWMLDPYNGHVLPYTKYNSCYVRAFLRLG